MLIIYNSLTNDKEVFKPREVGKISLYVCGMTVYDYCHIGHARAFMTFDTIVRYLRFHGYDVNYVRNITDIDDKIIKRANENGENFTVLTSRFIDALHEDFAALGMLSPDLEPKASESIPDIIAMVERLIDKGFAYVADNGDVCYEVRKFERYGALSNRDINDMRSGARIDVVNAKQDPLDFVLWKLAKPEEPSWPSPWGDGRPGWHIECSAMSTKHLGNCFDIHGGGIDLLFPHHENEIAQSEAATGEPFANLWMHIGHLQINKEKMSKSLGNFITIREALTKYHPEELRYFMITSHYRSPISYSDDSMNNARKAVQTLYIALRGLPDAEVIEQTDFEHRFHVAMCDDFNTPVALSLLFELAHEVNRLRETDISLAAQHGALLRRLGNVLGLLNGDAETYLRAGLETIDVEKVEALIAARKEARVNKDWEASDRIRDELTAMGIVLEDGPSGTTWRAE